MRRLQKIAAALIIGALTACGPQTEGLADGEHGRVAEVADGDTVVLDTGLRVTLTGIEAPYGQAPFAREARAGLERLVLHRPARLAYGGTRRLAPRAPQTPATQTPATQTPATQTPATQTPATQTPATQPPVVAAGPALAAATASPDDTAPAETALAQLFVQSEGGRWIWVQQAMLVEGLARVRTRKENVARADELLAAEVQARRERRGLWALADYRILTAEAALGQADALPNRCNQGPFLIIEGRVRQVSANDERVYLNFGEDYRSDVTIGIYGQNVSDWSARGPAFATYEGQRVRVRGRTANRGGPLVCVDHPEQIEVLAQP